jgi:hypothetical protein
MSWTPERIETLKTMWAQGHSASEIAKGLGGVTRNAVIGKVRRLGLPTDGRPASPAKALSRQSWRSRVKALWDADWCATRIAARTGAPLDDVIAEILRLDGVAS